MNPPRHVLMTTDTLGGVWTYSMELSRALCARGTWVSLATLGGPVTPSQREEAAAIPGLRTFESNYRLEWMEDPWDHVDESGRWLQGLARELRPDVIHLNGYAHGALQWTAPSVVVAHSCVMSWWRGVHGTEAPSTWSGYRWRVRDGLTGANAVAAVSGAMADALQLHYGFAGAQTIYNARQSSEYQPGPKEPFILTCGRAWDPGKNIAALDQAASRFHWPVGVAGEVIHPGSGGETDLTQANVLGHVAPDKLRGLFSRASIYALPARYEPFGLSILEAALSGCALVIGDIPSLREIWQDTAVFTNPSDPDQLVLAINILINSDRMRGELAEKARNRALSFTTERMLSGYLDLYERASRNFRQRREAMTSCAS